MTPSHSGVGDGLRVLAFTNADGSAWGAAISDGSEWSLVIAPDGAAPGEVVVSETSDGGWRLDRSDGGLSLLAEPERPPVAPVAEGTSDVRDPTPPGAEFTAGVGPELCRVTGTAAGEPVEWRGIRVRLAAASSGKDGPGSARMVAGWFADGSAVGLLAARSRRHDKPDHDAASATLFDRERWLAVAEPRLSTTYDEDDLPTRVNLELWIGEGEHEYPRRAAAEASGAPSASASGTRLRVVPLRCHSRGEDGVGVYVLATF